MDVPAKKNPVKDNLVLVAGIALPLLLIAFLALAKTIPGQFVDDPKYDLLLSLNNYQYGQGVAYRVRVINGKLKIEAQEAGKTNNQSMPRFFRFDSKTLSTREIAIDPPEKLETDSWTEVLSPETDSLVLDTKHKAPDGYTFDQQRSNGGGLLTEVFVSSRRRHQPAIVKNGRSIEVSMSSTEYYWPSVRFLGWVIEDRSNSEVR